jgi:hypothetical protein
MPSKDCKKNCKKKCCKCLCVPYVPNPSYNCENVYANPLSQHKTCCKCKKVCQKPVTSTVLSSCVSIYPQ